MNSLDNKNELSQKVKIEIANVDLGKLNDACTEIGRKFVIGGDKFGKEGQNGNKMESHILGPVEDDGQTPLLLEVNTHRAKLRDVVEKVVTSKLGMNLPLITHGSSLLYEVGDDLEEDEVANYAANLEKLSFYFL